MPALSHFRIRRMTRLSQDIIRAAVDEAQAEEMRACAFVCAERALGIAFRDFDWVLARAWRSLNEATP
jgi:hypothetical protein